jgi:hypothetical protein
VLKPNDEEGKLKRCGIRLQDQAARHQSKH